MLNQITFYRLISCLRTIIDDEIFPSTSSINYFSSFHPFENFTQCKCCKKLPCCHLHAESFPFYFPHHAFLILIRYFCFIVSMSFLPQFCELFLQLNKICMRMELFYGVMVNFWAGWMVLMKIEVNL